MEKMSKKEIEEKVERIMSVADEVRKVMFPLFDKNKMDVVGSVFVYAMLLDHLIAIVQRQTGHSFKDVKSTIMGLIDDDLDTVNKMNEEYEREHEKEA